MEMTAKKTNQSGKTHAIQSCTAILLLPKFDGHRRRSAIRKMLCSKHGNWRTDSTAEFMATLWHDLWHKNPALEVSVVLCLSLRILNSPPGSDPQTTQLHSTNTARPGMIKTPPQSAFCVRSMAILQDEIRFRLLRKWQDLIKLISKQVAGVVQWQNVSFPS